MSQSNKRVIYTATLEGEQSKRLERYCQEQFWESHKVPYAQFAYRGPQVNIVLYESKKLVVQGKGTEDFVQFILEPKITGKISLGYEEIQNPEWFEPHAGVDESGKGDLFGPLVSACVIADGAMVRHWLDNGLLESKKISSDKKLFALEKLVRGTRGVVIKLTWAKMEKYNELYEKMGSNLNTLLAWMHGKSINQALKERFVPWGLLDQFSKQPLVQRYVADLEGFTLKMRTKAESDPVVAAASVLARAQYVRQLKALSTECGFYLGKGVSTAVKAQGKELVKKLGKEALPKYVKMHFKTSAEIC